ncbi:hypothetical protein CRUP_034246, partial [Coryphaenoides rupestris]
ANKCAIAVPSRAKLLPSAKFSSQQLWTDDVTGHKRNAFIMPAKANNGRPHGARPARKSAKPGPAARKRSPGAKKKTPAGATTAAAAAAATQVDILSPAAMTNLYYISHNAMHCLEFRGFGWPKKKKGKKKVKGRKKSKTGKK